MQTLEFLDPRVGDEVHLLSITAAEDVTDEVPVRRVAELRALLQLSSREAMEIKPLSELDWVGSWLETLDDNHALEVTATRASGNLGEQLERAFSRTEIRQL